MGGMQLYTATTILLVLQSLYYDYIYRWLKGEKKDSREEVIKFP